MTEEPMELFLDGDLCTMDELVGITLILQSYVVSKNSHDELVYSALSFSSV